MYKFRLLLLVVAVGCNSNDGDGINNDPGPDDFRGTGGEAGIGGEVGAGGEAGRGGEAGMGGSAGNLMPIECPPGVGPEDAPFGFLTVCGDAKQFLGTTPVPDDYDYINEAYGPGWTRGSLHDEGVMIAIIGVPHEEGSHTPFAVIVEFGNSTYAPYGVWVCAASIPESPPCGTAVVDDAAKSVTLDSLWLTRFDLSGDIALTGTLYWERQVP
jgi:hypothetical protein